MIHLLCLLMLLADLVVQQPNPYEVIVTEATATSTSGATQTATPVIPTSTPTQTPLATRTATATPIATPTPISHPIIASPANGATVSGTTTISFINPSGNTTTIYVNGSSLGSYPFSYNLLWNSKNVSNGQTTISASASPSGITDSVTVNVQN